MSEEEQRIWSKGANSDTSMRAYSRGKHDDGGPPAGVGVGAIDRGVGPAGGRGRGLPPGVGAGSERGGGRFGQGPPQGGRGRGGGGWYDRMRSVNDEEEILPGGGRGRGERPY